MDNISRSVFVMNDYGKIKICLKEIVDAKGLSRNQLAKAVSTRYEVIDRWYKNEVEKMDLDVLARLCYVLECQPSDLIKYE